MKTIFTLFVCCGFYIANAQNLIAVEHNGASTFYSTLDSAVSAAQTGDNVYVPGGNFTLSKNISKGFNLIGVGYNPDSTLATGFTQITAPTSGSAYIVKGADGGSITGIYFYGLSIYFGTSASNQTVSGYTISRCRISSLNLGYSDTTKSTNIILVENIIEGGIQGNYIQNCFFSKNIVNGSLSSFCQGNQFLNNIFLTNSPTLFQVTNSIFKNNICLGYFGSDGFYTNYGNYNNTYYNNLFVSAQDNSLGTDIGDLFNIAQSSIFINQTGNSYDYKQNYHLKSTCPGKNYGTDGTDLGVYGTATPWKEGGVPYNPHIQFQSIATQTDGNGNLSVNIKVAAQKN